MIDQQLQEQAALCVLAALEAEEKITFETALAQNAELQAFVEEMKCVAATLAHSAPDRRPPPELQRRILAAIREEKPRHPWSAVPPWVPWALAASLAVCSGVLLLSRSEDAKMAAGLRERLTASERNVAAISAERDRASDVAWAEQQQQASAMQAEITRLNAERDALTRQVAQLQENEEAARVRNTTLAEKNDELEKKIVPPAQQSPPERQGPPERQSQASGVQVATLRSKWRLAPLARATVEWDGEKQEGILRTFDVPPNPTGRDYQLWLIDPNHPQPVDGGIFSVGKDGAAEIVFRPKTRITSAKAFAISLERKGGVPNVAGPIVFASK